MADLTEPPRLQLPFAELARRTGKGTGLVTVMPQVRSRAWPDLYRRRADGIVAEAGAAGRSPIPLRFCKWMTDLMAAGFLVSYFAWLLLFFVH